MTEELWLESHFSPKYSISSLGRIRNNRTETVRVQKINLHGYKVFKVRIRGKDVYFTVHRLVARIFMPNPENKAEINHIDGDRTNNTLSNLEWCTSKENLAHSRRITKNGAVVSFKKIKHLYEKNVHLNKEQFVELLLSECR